MKKKLLTLMMIGCMALAGVACGKENVVSDVNTSNETVTTEDATTNEPIASDDEVVEELEDDSEDDSEESFSEVWCGYLQSSKKDESGEPDEYGTLQPIIYDGGLEGDTFTIVGTLNFKATFDNDPAGMVPGDVNTFKVDENTKYQMSGGEAGLDDVTKEEFSEYFESLLDSGLYFQVEIEDGVAKVIQICS